MLKTVRCYVSAFHYKLFWEEMVTYDTDYWEYKIRNYGAMEYGIVRYLGKSSQVPKKPEGMLHCSHTFWGYEGTHLDLSNFDTTNVINMSDMFYNCKSLKSLDLSSFDTSNVTTMGGMFEGCGSLQSLDLSSFDTSNVANMGGMFDKCESLQSLDLSNFDTSSVWRMSCMFRDCKSLKSLNLSSFDTSKVTDMDSMFFGCESLKELDLSSFDTSKVTTMDSMFSGCESLKELDLSSFDTSKVTVTKGMFFGCESLKELDLSSFDTSKVTDKRGMFDKTNLTKKGTGFGTFSKKPKTPNVRNKNSICNKDSIRNKDSIDAIFNEIDDLFHNGNVISPSSLVKGLESKGYSESEIVGAIYNKIESGDLDRGMYMPVVNSYVSKVVIPTITKYFSDRNVGEVLDILYKKYPRIIVNEAMCMYLRPQYLVD